MKRVLSVFLAAILFTLPAFAAAEVLADDDTALFTCEGVFTLTCPVFWEFVPSEKVTDDAHCIPIGILTDPAPTGLVLDMYMVFFEHLASFNLFEADEEALEKYIGDTLADYEPVNGVFRETVRVMDDALPFAVFDLVDEYGPCIRAETMASGWGIFFDLYAYADGTYSACRPLTDEEYALFIQVLESFLPAIPEETTDKVSCTPSCS